LLTAGLIIAGACFLAACTAGGAGATATPSTEETCDPPAGAIVERDSVQTLHDQPDGRIAVLFSHHAAIYFLPKDSRCFAAWRQYLAESLSNKSIVEFTYTDAGQALTSVKPGQ
jgi:hypothetical protein